MSVCLCLSMFMGKKKEGESLEEAWNKEKSMSFRVIWINLHDHR